MNMYRQYTVFIAQLLLYAVAMLSLLATKALVWLPIYGTSLCWITPCAIAAPVLGSYTGSWFVIAVIIGKLLAGKGVVGATVVALARQLPSFVATISFASSSLLFRLAVPLVAFIIFNGYWWGTVAMVYSLLWLLPITLVIMQVDTLLSRSLIASFNAHAVGSLVWLYTDSLPAQLWFSLTPLAFVERLIIAGGIMVFSYGADMMMQRLVRYRRGWLSNSAEVL